MKKLFVFTLAFLMMVSSFLIVTAKEETETNPLSAAIKEICADPWEIESLSFSINPGHVKDNPYWKNYSYFTRDKESLLEAAQLLSKLEVSESGKTVTIDDACSAFLWITMKDGSMFELSYHDMNVLFYNGREYHGSIYDFADALYEIRMNEEPNSIVMPIAEENCYTVDLREFDVNKITFTERYDDGTKKVMTFEGTDNINELIGVIRRYMSLTYDGVTSEMPDDVTTLEIEVDDWYGGTKMLYIAPGKIDGTNVTNGRVWYEDREYVLDTLFFDDFEGAFENIASAELKVYESNSVLYDCVAGDAEISAIGYERCAKEEGKKNGYYDFFTVVRDKEYIDNIAEQFKSAKVVDISEDTPFKTNKYYTETVKLMYADGSVRKIAIDGNKLFYDGKEYRLYGLSDLYETVCEATRKQRPALECYGEVYNLAIWGETYSLDGEYWFNGRPSAKAGTVTKDELDIDIEDVDTANYIMWLLNSSALPYDDSVQIRPSLDVGTELYIDTDDGVVIDIAFCKDRRVIMSTGEHMTPKSSGLYMLPYDTAIEIFKILLDSSDGKLENVQDVEAATDALIGGFYEKCERIKDGADNDGDSTENAEDTTITPDFPTEDVYTIRYIDCTYEDGILKEHTIYDIEGVSVCAKIMEKLEGMTFKHFDGDVANSGNINYTEIVLTDWRGYNRELVFRYGKLCVLEEYFDYDAGELSDFKKFMDDFENKTVVDPNADDMVGTALSDDIAALLSDSSDIQSFTFTAEKLGGVTRSKADAPYDFSYMTSDPAYINEAVKLLAKCEFSKQPKIHEEVGYTEVTVTFWTANGKFELRAYANGKVSYNGTYYGYLSQLCEDVYKLRSREAGKGIIMKSGTSEYFELDLFAKDVVKLTYKGVGSEAVTIDDAEKIEKIGAYVRNYIWLTNAQKASVADVESSVLTIEYADGTSGKVFFTNFADGKVLVQDGATVRNYFIEDYEFDSFEQFFEFYELADSIKISDWAKPELEKAVLYGFGGIGDFSDDYSKNLTRLEVCDILVYPVNDIIGIHVMSMEPPYIDVYSQSVLDLTSVGAVEGKDVITVDGAVWKRIFAPDDLVTREELAKIACGIYRGGDYSTFSGYKADYELSDVTNTSFNDDEEISDWAKPYVEMARELGIFKGDDKGNFNPKGNCTKEEVIAVGVRLYEMMLENVK